VQFTDTIQGRMEERKRTYHRLTERERGHKKPKFIKHKKSRTRHLLWVYGQPRVQATVQEKCQAHVPKQSKENLRGRVPILNQEQSLFNVYGVGRRGRGSYS